MQMYLYLSKFTIFISRPRSRDTQIAGRMDATTDENIDCHTDFSSNTNVSVTCILYYTLDE